MEGLDRPVIVGFASRLLAGRKFAVGSKDLLPSTMGKETETPRFERFRGQMVRGERRKGFADSVQNAIFSEYLSEKTTRELWSPIYFKT